MNNSKSSALIIALSCLLMAGCKTAQLSELGKLERSIRKDLPFALDSLRWIDGADIMTFRFANQDYVDATPDVEIRQDGAIFGYNTFFDEQRTRQSEHLIWRNLLVSRKHRRVVCLDRYVRQGRTVGYGYVLQSEHKDYPRYGTFHWDVSAPGNMEVLGVTLTDLRLCWILLDLMSGDRKSDCRLSICSNLTKHIGYMETRKQIASEFLEEQLNESV